MQSDTTARRLAECKNATAALKDRDDTREKAWQTLKSCATRVSQAGSNTTDLSDWEWDRAVSDLDET
jgi:hypothetical protein